MKKILLMFTMFFAVMATAFSQTPENTEAKDNKGQRQSKMQKHDRDHAMDELGLSADQKSKMKVIRNEYGGKLKEIKANTALTKEEKRTQAEAIMAEQKTAMKNILTADQYAKMSAMEEKRKDDMKNSKGKNKNKEKEHKMHEKAEDKADHKHDNDQK